jgi:DNA ligase-1
MLCYPFEERRILNDMRSKYKWSWPVAVQPKLDGERCRFYFEPAAGTWTGLSSTEEPIGMAVPHIVEALNKSRIPKSVELDGELYCHGLPFEEIHSICSRRRNLHESHQSISYHVFDLISCASQHERFQLLSLASQFFPQCLTKVRTNYCHGLEELYQLLRDKVGAAYEGIIVRDLHAPYERKRCSWIMKFKPKQEDTYAIVGCKEEVDKNGVAKGTLGAFECSKDGENFWVGSGFTAKEREVYWKEYLANPKCFDGLSLRVEYQNITSGKVPRFGVYKGILVEGEE